MIHLTDPVHKPDNYEKWGASLLDADSAMILVHGRGATASGILGLSAQFARPGMAFLAPQATGGTWYPHSFLAPLSENEPHLSSALGVLERLVAQVRGNGIGTEHIYLLGFSQGACLVLEFAARNAVRYGGVFGLSGGLIGPPGTPRHYAGSFAGTPVFLGCSDVDPHIPRPRVLETATVLKGMGAVVDMRLYPDMPHTIIEDEIKAVGRLLAVPKAAGRMPVR